MLLALLGALASASWLCGMSTSDVEDVIDIYDLDTTTSELEGVYTTPFDCGDFEDLCAMYGTQAAESFVCTAWSDLRAHESESAINDHLESLHESYLVDADLGFWGGCPKSATDVSGSMLNRVRGTSFVVNLALVYRAIGGSTQAFERSSPTSGWTKDHSGAVQVASAFESTGMYTCTHPSKSASDTDGYVQVREWGFGAAGVAENVYSDHDYDVDIVTTLHAETCNTAGWNDPTCS